MPRRALLELIGSDKLTFGIPARCYPAMLVDRICGGSGWFAPQDESKVKDVLLRLIDRLADRAETRLMGRAGRSLPLIGRTFRRGKSRNPLFGSNFNILDVAFFQAAKESADYWCDNIITATACSSRSDLLAHHLPMNTRY